MRALKLVPVLSIFWSLSALAGDTLSAHTRIEIGPNKESTVISQPLRSGLPLAAYVSCVLEHPAAAYARVINQGSKFEITEGPTPRPERGLIEALDRVRNDYNYDFNGVVDTKAELKKKLIEDVGFPDGLAGMLIGDAVSVVDVRSLATGMEYRMVCDSAYPLTRQSLLYGLFLSGRLKPDIEL